MNYTEARHISVTSLALLLDLRDTLTVNEPIHFFLLATNLKKYTPDGCEEWHEHGYALLIRAVGFGILR